MKKLTIAILMSLGLISSVSAEIGVNVGVAGNLAVFHATGVSEDKNRDASQTDKDSEDATGVAGYTSLFIEKTLGPRLTIGIAYVPEALESETAENFRSDQTGTGEPEPGTIKNNKVKVDFDDLTTYYLALNVTENFYVKAGMVQVDVITQENLPTGSKYGNTSLDGTTYGLGGQKKFDNGMFIRVEGMYSEFDNASLTSTTNDRQKISLNDLEGFAGQLAIGKSF